MNAVDVCDKLLSLYQTRLPSEEMVEEIVFTLSWIFLSLLHSDFMSMWIHPWKWRIYSLEKNVATWFSKATDNESSSWWPTAPANEVAGYNNVNHILTPCTQGRCNQYMKIPCSWVRIAPKVVNFLPSEIITVCI